MTKMALITPVPMLNAMTSDEAPIAGSRDRADNVGDRARPDCRHADCVRIAKGAGHGNSNDERQERTEEQGDRPDQSGPARFLDMHFEGGCHDRKITEHVAAHQTNAAEEGDVGQTFGATSRLASIVGEDEPNEDRDRGAMDATKGQAARDESRTENHESDKSEGRHQPVILRGLF